MLNWRAVGKGMRWWGTAAGGAIGLILGGPVGALFGAALGQGVDRGLLRRRFHTGFGTAPPAQIQERFIEATFAVMGHLAKADGRVSEAEIAYAETVMERMALSTERRRAAIQWFNQGKVPGFALFAILDGLRADCAGAGALLELFLEFQLSMAHIDGPPVSDQRWILEEIQRRLRVSPATYQRLLILAALQRRMPGGAAHTSAERRMPPRGTPTPLDQAYAVLGVSAKANDAEIKRAYRRLMSQHHPDKLASRDLPEEALRIASEKTRQIRRAYETIVQARAAA